MAAQQPTVIATWADGFGIWHARIRHTRVHMQPAEWLAADAITDELAARGDVDDGWLRIELALVEPTDRRGVVESVWRERVRD